MTDKQEPTEIPAEVEPDGTIRGSSTQWQNFKEERYGTKGLIMQGDGNAVLYTKDGQAIWHSGTADKGGDTSVQDDETKD